MEVQGIMILGKCYKSIYKYSICGMLLLVLSLLFE